MIQTFYIALHCWADDHTISKRSCVTKNLVTLKGNKSVIEQQICVCALFDLFPLFLLSGQMFKSQSCLRPSTDHIKIMWTKLVVFVS